MATSSETTRATGRGEEARRRLLTAGLDNFARLGFEGASTRQIAQDARVNLSAITYHFGNKEGLYRAVVEDMIHHMDGPLEPIGERIATEITQPEITHQELIAHLQNLLDAFAQRLLGIADDQASRLVLIWMREQIAPSAAFTLLYEMILQRMLGPATLLVGRLLGKPADDPECRVRVFMLIGQVLVFRLARTAVMRTMQWESYTEERIAFIRSLVREQIGRSFSKDP